MALTLSNANKRLSAMMQRRVMAALETEIDNTLDYLEYALDRETYIKVINALADEAKVKAYEDSKNES